MEHWTFTPYRLKHTLLDSSRKHKVELENMRKSGMKYKQGWSLGTCRHNEGACSITLLLSNYPANVQEKYDYEKRKGINGWRQCRGEVVEVVSGTRNSLVLNFAVFCGRNPWISVLSFLRHSVRVKFRQDSWIGILQYASIHKGVARSSWKGSPSTKVANKVA